MYLLAPWHDTEFCEEGTTTVFFWGLGRASFQRYRSGHHDHPA